MWGSVFFKLSAIIISNSVNRNQIVIPSNEISTNKTIMPITLPPEDMLSTNTSLVYETTTPASSYGWKNVVVRSVDCFYHSYLSVYWEQPEDACPFTVNWDCPNGEQGSVFYDDRFYANFFNLSDCNTTVTFSEDFCPGVGSNIETISPKQFDCETTDCPFVPLPIGCHVAPYNWGDYETSKLTCSATQTNYVLFTAKFLTDFTFFKDLMNYRNEIKDFMGSVDQLYLDLRKNPEDNKWYFEGGLELPLDEEYWDSSYSDAPNDATCAAMTQSAQFKLRPVFCNTTLQSDLAMCINRDGVVFPE